MALTRGNQDVSVLVPRRVSCLFALETCQVRWQKFSDPGSPTCKSKDGSWCHQQHHGKRLPPSIMGIRIRDKHGFRCYSTVPSKELPCGHHLDDGSTPASRKIWPWQPSSHRPLNALQTTRHLDMLLANCQCPWSAWPWWPSLRRGIEIRAIGMSL